MKKKIIVRLTGGTGNELFIYCFVKYLELKKFDVFIDIYSGLTKYLGANPENNVVTLNKFKTNYKIADKKDCLLGFFGKIKRFFFRFLVSKSFYITEKNYKINLDKIIKNKYNKIYVQGYFQEKKFTDYVLSKYKNDFDLKKNSKKFLIMKNKINFKNSIFLGYRIFQKSKLKIFKDTNLKEILIFKKIEKYLSDQNLKNKIIYVATNNFQELINNIKIKQKIVELKFNYKKEAYHALDLCRNFRHFIIGKSTFHWWIQELAYFKNKKTYVYEKIHSPIFKKNMKYI